MNEKSLEQLIHADIEECRILLGVLEKNQRKKKDVWDCLAAISGVLVAIVGGIFTGIYSYNQNQTQKEQANIQKALQEQQNKILVVQTVERFLPHLSSDKNSTQKAAVIAIGELGYPEMATRIAVLYDSSGTRAGADALMASSTVTSQTQLVPVGGVNASTSKAVGNRWVYLGEYSTAGESWNKRYLDFSDNTNPENLISQVLKVRRETGTLNVREVPLGKVTGGLQPESSVKILEVKNYAGLGYMWARIE